MLLLDGIWHDDQEKVKVLGLSWFGKLSSVGILTANVS